MNILLIGATGGIGNAILQDLYEGNEIYATSTSQEKLNQLKQEFPKVKPILFDHTTRMEKEMLESIEKIDSLIIASGITSDCLSMRLSDELWDKTLEVNLSSSFRIIKNAYRKISRNGSIILISSVIARIGNIGQVAYSASKGGVEAMVRTLAREFASKGVTVNSIAPGFIETKMTESLDMEQMQKNIPLGRIGKPEEIAYATTFLISQKARYITGHTLEINGGLWMI